MRVDKYRDSEGFYVLKRKAGVVLKPGLDVVKTNEDDNPFVGSVEESRNRRLKRMVPYDPGDMKYFHDGFLGKDAPLLMTISDGIHSWSRSAWDEHVREPLNPPDVKYFMLAKDWNISRMIRMVLHYSVTIDGKTVYRFPDGKGKDRFELIESLDELERSLTFMSINTVNICRENDGGGVRSYKSLVRAVIAYSDLYSVTFTGDIGDFLKYLGIPITKEIISGGPIRIARKDPSKIRTKGNNREV